MLARKSERSAHGTLTVPSHGRRRSKTTEFTKTSDKLNTSIQNQVDMIKEGQEKLWKLVKNLEQYEYEINLDKVESVKDIVMKSEDLIVWIQVITKVRNELGHARLDLEKAKKAKKMVTNAKQRVKWLEERLEKLLTACHMKCSNLLESTEDEVAQSVSLAGTHLLSCLEDQLTPLQCERILCDVGGYVHTEEYVDEGQELYKVAVDVMENSQRMILKDNGSAHSFDEDDGPTPIQGESYGEAGKIKSTDGQGSENFHLQSGIEWVEDGCIASSFPRFILDEPTPCQKSRAGSPSLLYRSESGLHSRQSSWVGSDDAVEKYWRSDHHKFDWPSVNVQRMDPLSWHSLGLPVQDSFISKKKPSFTAELPWIEKPTQVNSVLDIHKMALNRLYTKLHHMYDAIEKATEASINPVPKNGKIETRIRNFESKSSSTVQKTISKISTHNDIEDGERGGGSLPTLKTKSVTFSKTPDLTYPTPGSSPAMVKVPRLLYPRSSRVWCTSRTSGGRIVKKITTKMPIKPNRTQAILTKKMLLGAQNENDVERQQEMIWNPSIVYKMLKATKALKIFQAQLQHWNVTCHSSPKWKRIQWLLGSSGLQSPTRAIVIEALKSLSQFRCSDEEVGDAVKSLLSKSQDARIMYEASKALILSGHWDAYAVEVLINTLNCGTNSLKKEVLDFLRTAEDISFIDRESPPFKQLQSALVELVHGSDKSLAFTSAVCLGQLCILDSSAKKYLTGVLKTDCFSSKEKAEALDVLVRQMNCKDDVIVSCLLHELNTSISWKVRVKACGLLMSLDPEETFVILERLLWDHPQQEVRSKVAELLNTLELRKKACFLVLKRLEDPEETVRARAIISLATLEMKGGKEMKALLDILALDSSIYARIQAIRAFSKLRWNDPRILRSLREREKGGGVLAKEAKKAMKQLTKLELFWTPNFTIYKMKSHPWGAVTGNSV